MWTVRNEGYHSFYKWSPERLRGSPRTTWLAGLRWNHWAGVPGHLIPSIVTSLPSPTAFYLYSNQIQIVLSIQKSPLNQYEAKFTHLVFSLCSGPTPFITSQWPSYFREENQAQQACSLSYCSAGCFAERKEAKWNKSHKGPKYYIIDMRELLRIKKEGFRGQCLFWRVKWMN